MKILKNLLPLFALLTVSNSFAANEGDAVHELFDQILRAHVSDGRVDYDAIQFDTQFNRYLDLITNFDPDRLSSRAEKLAFWINAYNALAIKGIIDGHSPKSLFGRYKYFKSVQYDIARQRINLYDLEHEIIIPLGEPRIHFAIVCASLSCPALRSEAYIASKLERQLNENASRFINNSDKNDFDGKQIYVSRIFEWFEKDFSTHSGSLQKYLAQYVKDPALVQKLEADALKVGYLAYDWRLNGKRGDG